MKRLPVDLPDDVKSCLVIGKSKAATNLKKRLSKQEGLKVDLQQDTFISGKWDYAFLVDGDIDLIFKKHRDNIKVIQMPNEEDTDGYCASQKLLILTDWQALRDAERQLLAMDKAGIWTLPDIVRSRMTHREQLRTSVDKEIG